MMYCSRRSAKSVAWIKLKEVGVNISFFLPRRVVSRTSGEEFHSLKVTAYPRRRSHCESSEICVDLPEPSIPSTTIKRPGQRFCRKTCISPYIINERAPGLGLTLCYKIRPPKSRHVPIRSHRHRQQVHPHARLVCGRAGQ